MKIVRENINFERGSENPFRSLDVGRYAQIRKELKVDLEIDLDDAIDMVKKLSRMYKSYFKNGKWKGVKPNSKLSKSLSHFGNDAYHTDKINFLKTFLEKVAMNKLELSEQEFLDSVIEYTEDVDYNPRTFIDTINGVLYDVEMR